MKYFNYTGSVDKIIVSNSSLSAINPEQGGSPKKFIDFITNNYEQTDTKATRIGSTVDIYVEDQAKFEDKIAIDATRPTDSWFNLVESMIKIQDNNPTLEFQESELVLLARQDVGFQSNWKDETMLAKYETEASAYYGFFKENRNKIILTKDEKNIVDKCIDSIRQNEKINSTLFDQTESSIKITQCAIYFKIDVKLSEKNEQGLPIFIELTCKALLDQLIIDSFLPAIIINDFKTTGYPISTFEKSIESYKYYRQLSFYKLAVDQWLKGKGVMYDNTTGEQLKINKPDIDKIKNYYNLLVVETSNYFYSNMFCLPHKSAWFEKGRNEISSLLQRIAWHKLKGEWNQQMEMVNGFSTVKEPEL